MERRELEKAAGGMAFFLNFLCFFLCFKTKKEEVTPAGNQKKLETLQSKNQKGVRDSEEHSAAKSETSQSRRGEELTARK